MNTYTSEVPAGQVPFHLLLEGLVETIDSAGNLLAY